MFKCEKSIKMEEIIGKSNYLFPFLMFFLFAEE